MPPKRTGPEREAQRLHIWESHTKGDFHGAIAVAERMAWGTVADIIKQIGTSGVIEARTSSGRPSTLSKRCGFPLIFGLLLAVFHHFQVQDRPDFACESASILGSWETG